MPGRWWTKTGKEASMRVFELRYPERFNGKVVYKFFDDDSFAGIDYSEASVNIEQAQWLMKNIPVNAYGMNMFTQRWKMEVVEVVETVDFKAFWDRYNDKARSSRVKTERVWRRMSKAEQVKAYNFIPKYLHTIPGGVMKKYATTYLNDQLWNN